MGLCARTCSTRLWSDSKLTPRELEVLSLAAEGLSNKEVAATLGLSEKTVKNRISNIFAKLRVNDRTQAVVYAAWSGCLMKAPRYPSLLPFQLSVSTLIGQGQSAIDTAWPQFRWMYPVPPRLRTVADIHKTYLVPCHRRIARSPAATLRSP